jgi:hypothetical protein
VDDPVSRISDARIVAELIAQYGATANPESLETWLLDTITEHYLREVDDAQVKRTYKYNQALVTYLPTIEVFNITQTEFAEIGEYSFSLHSLLLEHMGVRTLKELREKVILTKTDFIELTASLTQLLLFLLITM